MCRKPALLATVLAPVLLLAAVPAFAADKGKTPAASDVSTAAPAP
ncbi:pilus assembly protein TadD, partial [Caulobacter sp. D4A]